MTGLDWVVRARYKNAEFARAWEPIAAFNVESVAKRYALSCRETNPEMEYRVGNISPKMW